MVMNVPPLYVQFHRFCLFLFCWRHIFVHFFEILTDEINKKIKTFIILQSKGCEIAPHWLRRPKTRFGHTSKLIMTIQLTYTSVAVPCPTLVGRAFEVLSLMSVQYLPPPYFKIEIKPCFSDTAERAVPGASAATESCSSVATASCAYINLPVAYLWGVSAAQAHVITLQTL